MPRRSLFVCAVFLAFAMMPVAAQAGPVASASTTVAATDVWPPVLQVAGVADGGVYGSAIAPQITCADADLATLRLTLDGNPWASGGVIGSGRHVLDALAVDTSGNSTEQTYAFAVDTLSPEFHAFVLAPGVVNVYSGYRDITFTIDLSDDLTGIDTAASGVRLISPRGASAIAVTPMTLVSGDSAGGDGVYVQTLRIPQGSEAGVWRADVAFFDRAGHRATPVASNLIDVGQTYIVAVSNTQEAADAVSAAILSVTPGDLTFGTTVTLTGEAADSLGHTIVAYEWSSSRDGVLGTGSRQSFRTSSLSVGTHSISLRAQCSDGTWSSPVTFGTPVVVRAVQSDALAPATVSDAKPAYAGSAIITLTAADLGGSGVDHTYYVLDGGSRVEGTLVATSAVGPHELVFWSVDRAGNVETATRLDFSVTLPKATVSTPSAPSGVHSRAGFTVTGTVAPRHSSGTYLVTLYFYRYQSGHYVLRKTVRAKRYSYSSSKSKYAARVSLSSRGRWRIRALHADATHAASWSGYRYVTVR
jgi:hypothetical protein